MIPKSGNRFSEKIMRQEKSMIPKKPARGLDPGVATGFPPSSRLRCKGATADFGGLARHSPKGDGGRSKVGKDRAQEKY
jgi:hypothetical protein